MFEVIWELIQLAAMGTTAWFLWKHKRGIENVWNLAHGVEEKLPLAKEQWNRKLNSHMKQVNSLLDDYWKTLANHKDVIEKLVKAYGDIKSKEDDTGDY